MPSTLTRDISPPPRPSKRRKRSDDPKQQDDANGVLSSIAEPSLAAVEAGRAKVEDHLTYFKERLSKVCRPVKEGAPRISIDAWATLYERNAHKHGNHFVVHQHNHPVSGVHCKIELYM